MTDIYYIPESAYNNFNFNVTKDKYQTGLYFKTKEETKGLVTGYQ